MMDAVAAECGVSVGAISSDNNITMLGDSFRRRDRRMNSEIRTVGRTAFGAPLEFLFTKRRINDKMQFVGAIQSLDTPRRAGSVFEVGRRSLQ